MNAAEVGLSRKLGVFLCVCAPALLVGQGCIAGEQGAGDADVAEAQEALCALPGNPDKAALLYELDFHYAELVYDQIPWSHGADGCGINVRTRATSFLYAYPCAHAYAGLDAPYSFTQTSCESAFARVYLYGLRKSNSTWENVGYSTTYGVWNGSACQLSTSTYGYGGKGSVTPDTYSELQANCSVYANGTYLDTACDVVTESYCY